MLSMYDNFVLVNLYTVFMYLYILMGFPSFNLSDVNVCRVGLYLKTVEMWPILSNVDFSVEILSKMFYSVKTVIRIMCQQGWCWVSMWASTRCCGMTPKLSTATTSGSRGHCPPMKRYVQIQSANIIPSCNTTFTCFPNHNFHSCSSLLLPSFMLFSLSCQTNVTVTWLLHLSYSHSFFMLILCSFAPNLLLLLVTYTSPSPFTFTLYT